MPVLGLNHINIRTPDFTRTLEFLREALGMRVSAPPALETMDRGAWVYDASGAAVLHLASADVAYSPSEVLPDEPARGSGAIHHVALSCAGFEAMKDRLVELDLRFRENAPEIGVRQIFVEDPTGILFELNFRDE